MNSLVNIHPASVNNLDHPCFDQRTSHHIGRIHLPVAPKCNIRCNYCVRRFSCFNESKPGHTASVLDPHEAVELFEATRKIDPRVKVVGIAGPGDALANKATFETLKLLNDRHSNNLPTLPTICLSTNGLLLPEYAKELARLNVVALTVTVNAMNPEVASRIYRYVNYGNRRLAGDEASELLISKQLEGIQMAAKLGIRVKINTVFIPGINDGEIVGIARKVASLGADRLNIIPVIPQAVFSHLRNPTIEEISKARNECRRYINIMTHCQRCRADAVGLINEQTIPDKQAEWICDLSRITTEFVKFAVASTNGLLVDQHFGHANKLFIYSAQGLEVSPVKVIDMKPYCSNSCEPEERIESLISDISGCSYLLCKRIGPEPAKSLKDNGIQPVETYGKIEETIKAIVAKKGENEIYRQV